MVILLVHDHSISNLVQAPGRAKLNSKATFAENGHEHATFLLLASEEDCNTAMKAVREGKGAALIGVLKPSHKFPDVMNF